MNDQAGALRQIVANIKRQRAREPGQGARIVCVTSGKGGVGKTNFAVNLGLSLSRKGLRVLIVDADFGLSNVDVLLGINPDFDLSHVIKRQKRVRDVICEGPYGIRFISGGSGVLELIRMNAVQLQDIMDCLMHLEDIADVILFDTGAGISPNIRRLIGASQEVIVVTTPEPTAIMDAYALVKTVSSIELAEQRVRLVVNRAESTEEGQNTLQKISAVVRLYLKIEIEELGYILSDPVVPKAVRVQRPFVLSFPKSEAARCIEAITWRFMDMEPERRTGLRGFLYNLVGKNKPVSAAVWASGETESE